MNNSKNLDNEVSSKVNGLALHNDVQKGRAEIIANVINNVSFDLYDYLLRILKPKNFQTFDNLIDKRNIKEFNISSKVPIIINKNSVSWKDFCLTFGEIFFAIPEFKVFYYFEIINEVLLLIKKGEIVDIEDIKSEFDILLNEYKLKTISKTNTLLYVEWLLDKGENGFKNLLELLNNIPENEMKPSSNYEISIKNYKISWRIFLYNIAIKFFGEDINNVYNNHSLICKLLKKVKNKDINSFDELRKIFDEQKGEKKSFSDKLNELKTDNQNGFNKFVSLLRKISSDEQFTNVCKTIEFDGEDINLSILLYNVGIVFFGYKKQSDIGLDLRHIKTILNRIRFDNKSEINSFEIMITEFKKLIKSK